MSRLSVLFLLAVALFLGARPMLAANYAVGTCKPSLPSYASISAAVSSVPPGSTVQVCPGTYAEQVTIAQPLTLKGITSANAGQAVITVPGGGLVVASSSFGYSVAPQVAVTSGAVNITDITVDGTGNGVSGAWLAGIFYETGSFGTVNGVTVRNLADSGLGVGIWAENGGSTNESVTIENSSFHDIDDTAVVGLGSTLLATVKGNTMQTSGYEIQDFASGAVSANVINGGSVGVSIGGPLTVTGNTISNQTYGILASAGVTASTNKISNTSYGIYDQGGGNTYQSNLITKSVVGIEFDCQSPTVLHNTINDATTGLDFVPASFSGANTYNNVVTLRTAGCSAARSHGTRSPTAGHSGVLPAPAH